MIVKQHLGSMLSADLIKQLGKLHEQKDMRTYLINGSFNMNSGINSVKN